MILSAHNAARLCAGFTAFCAFAFIVILAGAFIESGPSCQRRDTQMKPTPYALDLWRDDNPMPVVAYATCRRVSGEPGSLSIQAGYEIDISRVTFRGNPIDISPAERADIEREILNNQDEPGQRPRL